MLLMRVVAEITRVFSVEESNVAVSVGWLGGPPGVQLVAAFQSPLPGLGSQVAEPANTVVRLKMSPVAAAKTEMILFILSFSPPARAATAAQVRNAQYS
jgi:hypothetical protein